MSPLLKKHASPQFSPNSFPSFRSDMNPFRHETLITPPLPTTHASSTTPHRTPSFPVPPFVRRQGVALLVDRVRVVAVLAQEPGALGLLLCRPLHSLVRLRPPGLVRLFYLSSLLLWRCFTPRLRYSRGGRYKAAEIMPPVLCISPVKSRNEVVSYS